MNILVLLLTAVSFIAMRSQAQFSENFDQNITGLSSDCWLVNQFNYSTTTNDVINGTGSAYTNPPTSSSGERTLATPFLDITSTSLTVSFKYKISSKIGGNATRTINIGLVDKNGNFTSLQLITMDKTFPTSVQNLTATYTLPSTGTYRLQLRVGGATGDGNSRVIFDDLSVNATPHYGPASHCNTPGIAVDDSYTIEAVKPVSANLMTNDQLPGDNEIYTPVIVAAPTSGTLVVNTDGTFTFTPDPSFTGGTVTFTYNLVDNGYSPATSNVATVTLNYPAPMILPILLLDFSADVHGSDVDLEWSVDNNDEGNYFEVQKSVDGKSFVTIDKVYANEHSVVYTSRDEHLSSNVHYRLKIVNDDGSVTFSKTILVKGSGLLGPVQVLENPVQNVIRFTLHASNEAVQSLQIFSITGAKLSDTKLYVSKGMKQYSVNVQQLPSGTYVMMLNAGSERKAVKFMKR